MDEILPDFGQDCFVFVDAVGILGRVLPEELVDHLVRTSGLGRGEAARVIADVLAYFAEPVEVFVRRRHAELQARGLTNEEIFRRVGAELEARRVAPPELSARQLRRIVYG
ncbi:hypothetical protein GCM10027589_35420 [Actinocorallia lasiicapitis]